jgi:hypothetical protein
VISRAQRILFAVMVIAVVTMSTILIRLRERAQDRLHIVRDSSPPMIEEAGSAPQSVALFIPNDLDGSLQQQEVALALPADDSTRARVLLEVLLETFHNPRSTHPITSLSSANGQSNQDIEDVFLMPIPLAARHDESPGLMAIVDFSAAFAASHPSGIEPETLTLLAISGTLHANIPAITQVRFLIDGHPADTLAGHADLTRTYLAAESATGTGQP